MATTGPVSNKRIRRPSIHITDENNIGELELSEHRRARQEVQTQLNFTAASQERPHSHPPSSLPPSPFARSDKSFIAVDISSDDEDPGNATDATQASVASQPPKKKARKVKKSTTRKKKATPKRTSTPSATTGAASTPPATASTSAAASDGAAASEPESDDEPMVVKPRARDRTKDISPFFKDVEMRGPKGKEKPFRRCRLCPEKYIVPDVSTLRRHLGSYHESKYRRWCSKNDFLSKLPKDIRARATAAEAEADIQGTLDGHVKPIPPKPTIIKYSDAIFQEAAEDWLIITNQPLDALSHPKFQYMVDVASRAPDGVKIPEKKNVRASIIHRFQKNVQELRHKLNSDKVRGEVSLTCDAWQAGNRDAYFAVTGHWIEEVKPTDWRLRSAVLGFTQMNTAHNGARLGRALYDIAKRYGIAHKVGWVTCDNATNNNTMLKWFETKINAHPSRRNAAKWTAKQRHIRCLAHIVNLATQAVISTYSSTPHINTDSTAQDVDGALDDLADISVSRDEVGLVRVITVKARSSAKRTALFKELQGKDGVKLPLNLILDMKVRWSSTFAMLQRAYDLRVYINDFVFKMSEEETSPEKQRKLRDLAVTKAEWDRVRDMLKILKHADDAQHAFSSQTDPALSHALPALEKLHKTWTALAGREKYFRYQDALNAGIEKIATYYNKASGNDAYIMAMILDPSSKAWYQKEWADGKEAGARLLVERIFKARWAIINKATTATSTSAPAAPTTRTTSRSRLDIDVSDDESTPAPTTTPEAAAEPWRREFNRYINSDEVLEEKQSVVTWWGINAHRFETWASLARDYLAIMASSVSSERAFSAAGITISKRRNALKADIVEALQVLKSLISTDMIFREPDTTLDWEFANEYEEDDHDPLWEDVDDSDRDDDDLVVVE